MNILLFNENDIDDDKEHEEEADDEDEGVEKLLIFSSHYSFNILVQVFMSKYGKVLNYLIEKFTIIFCL